ncbi:cyclic lactone autoinducer peptide [Sporobacter termitidis]|nr:cyclic lactone autoinducer peptide [Sporobacter termitidis]
MKTPLLKLVANIAAKAVSRANDTASTFWTYQPKAPEGIKNFKK